MSKQLSHINEGESMDGGECSKTSTALFTTSPRRVTGSGLFVAIAFALVASGCGPSQSDVEWAKEKSQADSLVGRPAPEDTPWGKLMILEYGGCEYVMLGEHGSRSITHAGNCANPIHSDPSR